MIDRGTLRGRTTRQTTARDALPVLAGVRCVPLAEPTPLYAWSLLWRTGDGHPGLRRLTGARAARAGHGRWLEYDPARDRLPEPSGTAWARQPR
ncbi:hypothetical protein [Streptomyces sp. NPDC017638]|uniref:hypothetical protein n=1 Tax=Streptomyces sp. NPDC017638 TaxID=3365004 RepID=UPI00379EE060